MRKLWLCWSILLTLGLAGCGGSSSNPTPISKKLVPKFAYVANSSTANVSAFTVNPSTGALTAVAGSPFVAGSGPITLAVDPASKFLYVANKGSFDISVFSINIGTGALTSIPGSPFTGGENPQGLLIHPSGKFLYVTNVTSINNNLTGAISAFLINSSTGAISPLAGSPFPAGSVPDA